MSKPLGPGCVPNNLVDVDAATPGLQPQCQVSERYVNDAGTVVTTVLNACAASTPPCWSLDTDVAMCPGAFLNLRVHRNPGALPNGLTTSLSCAACLPGVSAPGCP